MTERCTLLDGLTEREFLDQHWQKRPLLARGALPGFVPPFGRDEVAALAGDPAVTSRAVTAPRQGNAWTTRRGPLSQDDLAALPEVGWTILLHEMDRRFRDLAALLERFRFIPNWRVDDVMVSYATDGGGVGPHIDRYDVFLLQAQGRRRWRIGGAPLDPGRDARLVPGIEHSVLECFTPAEEWVLEPGDMLYLPPRFAHDGVAVGECMTCSIGFRAPDPRELYSSFLRQLGPDAFDGVRYADPDLEPAKRAGEIPVEARRSLREAALELFEQPGAFDHWVGRFVTTPTRGGSTDRGSVLGADELHRMLEDGSRLDRSAPPHFSWFRDDDGAVRLFVGGEAYRLDAGSEALAELLCGRQALDHAALAPHLGGRQALGVVLDLVLRGFLSPRA